MLLLIGIFFFVFFWTEGFSISHHYEPEDYDPYANIVKQNGSK